LTGSVGQFDELDEDFDQITVGDYNQEFQLVYQGKTYEVDGLTCLKAEIEYNGKKVISGPTDYIYNITSTNDRLLALTPLVSPFAEDDNCVRVIFLPCQSAGTIVQPGDVLGTLKIIKPDYFDIVRDELIYSSSILANLWLQENQAPKFLSKSKFQELIIDWRKNNEKWRTELKEKKEEGRKEKEKTKEKNIAKIEIDKLKKVMKKEEKLRKHELWLQDTQKKKMEKIEILKKRQAEQRRLKHERLERQKQAYDEDFHPVFGKPMVFGNATGFPDSKYPNSEEFVTTREGGYDESTRGGFGKYSDGIRYEESTRRGFEKSSSRGRYYESTRGSFEKSSREGRYDESTRRGFEKSTRGGFEKSSRVWLDESTRGGFDISTRGGLASSTRGRSDNSISGGYENLSSGVFDKSTEGCFDSDFGNNQNNKRTYPCTSGSSANLLGSKLAKVEQSDPTFNNPAGHDEKNSDFLYEEAQSMFQITVAGTSSLSAGAQRSYLGINPALFEERGAFGRNIDMRGGQSSVGGGNHMGSGNDVRDIEMERLEVQLRKKKLMEDILNSQRELLKLEQAEENLLKKD